MSIQAGMLVRAKEARDLRALVLTDPTTEPGSVLVASIHRIGSIPRTGQDVEVTAEEAPSGVDVGFFVALWNTRRALIDDLKPLVPGAGPIEGEALNDILSILDSVEMGEDVESPRLQRSWGGGDPERIAELQRREVDRWRPITQSVLDSMYEDGTPENEQKRARTESFTLDTEDGSFLVSRGYGPTAQCA